MLVLTSVWGCAGTRPPEVSKERPAETEQDRRRSLMAFHHFTDGTLLYSDERYNEAASAFEQALRYDPESATIRLSLASAYMSLRQYERAATVVEAIPDKDEGAYSLLGRAYSFTGRNDEARSAYLKVLELDSTDAQAYWFVSRLALREGQFEEASGYLIQMARHRREPRIFNELAELKTRLGQHADAADAYRSSLTLDSTLNNRHAFIGLAASLESLRDVDGAANALRRLLRLSPDDNSVRRQLVQLFLNAGLHDDARSEIEQILEYNPQDPERLRLGVLLYNEQQYERAESVFVSLVGEGNDYIPLFYLGRIAATGENYVDAKRFFQRAVQVNDSIPDAWIAWGNVLLAQDSLDAAIELAHVAESTADNPSDFWYFVGLAFSRHDLYDSAIVWLRKAYHADTLDSRVQFSLAASHERAGNFDVAARLFEKLLEREPNNASALNYLGYMYADSGVHLDVSLRMIERAVELAPENGAYRDSYGWVLFRLGHLDEAEVQIRKALAILDTDSVVFEHLGDILAACGRHDEALASWRRALELDPGSRPILEKLGIDP